MATTIKLYAMSDIKLIRTKKELQEMLPGGRYEGLQYVIGGNGKYLQVNYLVWVDHEMMRERLVQKNLRKNLAPYNPVQVAKELALYADKELALEGMRG